MVFGETIEPGTVYRSIGVQQAERYGIGFMDKSGVSVDMYHRAHSSYVMVLVLQGQGEYVTDGGASFALTKGCCFQRFPGRVHTVLLDPSSHWLECFLELGAGMFGLLRRCTGLNPMQPVLPVTLTEGLVERFVKLRADFRTESDMKLARRLPEVLELAQILHGHGQVAQQEGLETLLEEACEFLTADFQLPVDFPGFCQRHGWSYEHFRKIFKAELGASPHQYRVRRRLDAACALLSYPQMTVKEVAQRLGYSSPYEFSAQFKRYIGCPPREYLLQRQEA